MTSTPHFPARRPSPIRNHARLDVAAAAAPAVTGTGLRGLRLTGRGRAVVATLSLCVALPIIGLNGSAVASAPERETAVQEHTVRHGETMWGFARQIAEPGEDVRNVVRDLMAINDMDTARLQAGQTILLPLP
ncbi:MAG: LysM peptidoglycan-binding domain-containing protein [Promicromonosporaceae bacterium]|nr:LysM peptidoglycan-binding domain-containing protein [Promicromonosporaceae bacterium]